MKDRKSLLQVMTVGSMVFLNLLWMVVAGGCLALVCTVGSGRAGPYCFSFLFLAQVPFGLAPAMAMIGRRRLVGRQKWAVLVTALCGTILSFAVAIFSGVFWNGC